MQPPAKATSASPAHGLPTEKDFDPLNGDLDAQLAWKKFGGLDLEQAYQKFCGNPMFYDEGFMCIGPNAFKFYFPVVVRYLQGCPFPEEYGDSQAWFIGKAMVSQVERAKDDELLEPIGDLCQYVRTHLSIFAVAEGEQDEINAAWLEVESVLARRRDAGSR